MEKMPDELRRTIARNIRICRVGKFPGRGGAKRCAEAFGVSAQQWSPWERGVRTPDEFRLGKLAGFFGVTVEWLRSEHADAAMAGPDEQPLTDACAAQMAAAFGIPPYPPWQHSAPGTPASFFWLAHHLISHLQTNGLRIDMQCLDYLAQAIRSTESK